MKQIYTFTRQNRGMAVLTILFIVFCCLIVMNNNYNHPVADDYSNYNTVMRALGDRELGLSSLFSAVQQFSVDTYNNWQGTYFSNIIFSLNPLLLSLSAYRITMLAIQLFFMFSIFFLFLSIAKTQKNLSIKDGLLLSIVYFLLSVVFMFSTAEGLYWFTGTALYLIPFSMSMILFGLLVRYLHNKKIHTFIAITLMLVALGGTNYITGLFVGFCLLISLLYSLTNKTKYRIVNAVMLLVFAVSFGFNVLAPGNYIRIAKYEQVSISKAILLAMPVAVEMVIYLVFSTLIVPILILLSPIYCRYVKTTTYNFKHPFALLILCSLMFIALFVPITYSYGSFYEAGRIKNLQFFYLVLTSAVCWFYLLGHFAKKNNQILDRLVKKTKAIWAIGLVFAIVLFAAIGVSNTPGYTLYRDVVFGNSKRYDSCMTQRELTLASSKENVVEIQNCSYYPKSLHSYNLPQDENNWVVIALETFYKKKIIVKQ